MKNIHILPTENPSSLFEIDGHLIINKEQLIQPKYYRNIYITNDEDINENDYIITKDGRLVQVSYLLSKDLEEASKVILTTDHDLFKDDVQAIDDEFHDWFVKNPSCEFVKTKLVYDYEEHPELVGNPKEEWSYYKIIIPQEKAKQDTVGKEFYESADKVITVKRQEKKPHSFCETPEEQCTMNYCDENGCQNRVRHLVEPKQEQDKKMYNEEEVLEILNDCRGENPIDIDKWFEQFKKK
jgi:hypothetical protein